jgi:predicted TIM-barrel fold metal-dependent hydrolase
MTAMTPTRTYTGPVVDAHQHFWEPHRNRNPWLAPGVQIPFRYGDYTALKRSYLPPDYLADARGHDVVATVYVETEWDPADPIGETRYVHAVAERHGFPHAVVAQAWLDRPDVEEVLAAQAAFPLVRSVRHKPERDVDPAQLASGRTLMSDPRWRSGYALLERFGLHFDLQVSWRFLGEAAALAAEFPRTLIVLNHTGLPADRSPAGLAGWRAAMATFAAAPNTMVKISGLGQPGRPWTVEANRSIVLDTIAMFGPARVMFASNYPVDGLCGTFDEIYAGFTRIVAHLDESDQRAMFNDNAARVYLGRSPTVSTPTTQGDASHVR